MSSTTPSSAGAGPPFAVRIAGISSRSSEATRRTAGWIDGWCRPRTARNIFPFVTRSSEVDLIQTDHPERRVRSRRRASPAAARWPSWSRSLTGVRHPARRPRSVARRAPNPAPSAGPPGRRRSASFPVAPQARGDPQGFQPRGRRVFRVGTACPDRQPAERRLRSPGASAAPDGHAASAPLRRGDAASAPRVRSPTAPASA